MKLRTAASIIALTACSQIANAQITGRTVPSPILGVTFDDVGRVSSETTALRSLARFPTVRIVIDQGEPASYYKGPITAFHPYAYIMAEMVDSSYMSSYTLNGVQSLMSNYISTLGSLVDIWEIGNEVNGNWLSNQSSGSDVMPKVAAMYDAASAAGGRTLLTFFYEGEPNEPNNCIARDHGGNDMFSWIHTHFTNAPTAESEKIRLGLNYVGVSWYPDQCRGEMPNWGWVYTQLAQIFPNAQVGFSELGTANPQGGSTYEKNEISSIYPMTAGTGGLPNNYYGGVFWWYAAEEIVPWPGSLGNAINAAVGSPVVQPPSATLSASPASITIGSSSTLSYSYANVQSCTGTNFTPSVTSTSGSGTATVSPTATTTYVFNCTGTNGGTTQAQATVTVTPKTCP